MTSHSSLSTTKDWTTRLSRYRSLIIIGVIFAASGILWYQNVSSLDSASPVGILSERLSFDADSLHSLPQTRKNIAVASGFGYHHDVYIALVWTIQRVMKEGNVQVYAPWPLTFDFQSIVDEFGLYNGTIKDPSELIHDISNDSADGAIDMVVLGTCEIDLRPDPSAKLLAAWDARDAAHKFQVVCIIHNALDAFWKPTISEWSRRNAIRLLPISEHVGKAFRTMFQDRARSADPVLNSAGYEYIPIDVHVPILDVPYLPTLPPTRVLSNAVVQGSFANDRRDYTRIFAELVECLHASPKSWGYLPLGDRPSFIPDMSINSPPFKLHLVGSGWVDIPLELKHLIVFHTGLEYKQFYRLMGGMDVCIPAFHSARDDNYRVQASSTVAMCMEVNVPILATQQLREAYTHIDDDRIMITRPAVMSEAHAIQALRMGNASSFLASDPSRSGITLGSHPHIREAVEKMMREGWVRSKEGFEACKRTTWSRNEVVVMRLLRDL